MKIIVEGLSWQGELPQSAVAVAAGLWAGDSGLANGIGFDILQHGTANESGAGLRGVGWQVVADPSLG